MNIRMLTTLAAAALTVAACGLAGAQTMPSPPPVSTPMPMVTMAPVTPAPMATPASVPSSLPPIGPLGAPTP